MPVFLRSNNINKTTIGLEGQALKYIVRDNLVLYLDAGNLDSYSGSGSTWYDISGNGRDFNIGAGITWNSGGYFTCSGGVFTGPPSNTFGFTNLNEHYVEAYVQVLSATGNVFFAWYATPSLGGDNRAVFSHLYYSNGNTYYDVNGCCDPTQRISYLNDPDLLNGVRCVSYRTRTDVFPNRQIFKNAVPQVDSGSYSTPTVTWNDSTLSNIGNYWNGNLYLIRVYNRALSDSEILQNYNTERARFNFGSYYNCGYGCQFYTFNPGCTAC